MSQVKRSQGRRRSGHEINTRASVSTIEQLPNTNDDFANEIADESKTSGTPPKRNRSRSGSSTKIRTSDEHGDHVSDGSKEQVASDNLTYTKYDSDSNERIKNLDSPINSVRKVEDYLMRHENPKIIQSLDNNHARKLKKRKSRKQRKDKSRALELTRNAEQENFYDDDYYDQSTERRESESPENEHVRKEKRWKSKKRQKGETRISESNRTREDDLYEGDRDRKKSKKLNSNEPRISKRRKRRRSNAEASVKVEQQEKELPITEILRQAQENSRNRYEESLPLPELTTDTIYVQRKNGFSAVKINSNRNVKSRRHLEFQGLNPIKVAIAAQNVWYSTGLIYQGLLAGIALMHLLLIQTFFELPLDFPVSYSRIAEIYTNIFTFLATMCVVLVIDKFDLAHLNLEHLREIYVDHFRSFLAVPLYITTFCLHQASSLVDDKISLLNYPRNGTEFENNSTEAMVAEHLVTWRKVTLAKDGLAVIAWLFVVLGPREDMFLTHLKSMEKYADSVESSHRENVETTRRNIGDR